MRLFDIMIDGIILYGVEIWGWKRQKEIERIQEKYIRWIMNIDRQTPAYLILKDTGRNRLEIKAGKRIVRWEKK
jgi:hypothetical protein